MARAPHPIPLPQERGHLLAGQSIFNSLITQVEAIPTFERVSPLLWERVRVRGTRHRFPPNSTRDERRNIRRA